MYAQAIKSAICTCIGGALGIAIYLSTGQTFGLVVAGLGGFIGFGLSLPSTSLSRVARGTAGVIVAYNLPGSLGRKTLDTFLGESDNAEVYSPQAARGDFRKLRHYNGVITVTDSAAAKLRDYLSSSNAHGPLRIIATISKENPYFLHYEMYRADTWNPDHDVLCVASDIEFVLDELTVARMNGTTLTWQDRGSAQGFSFGNPTWPRTDLSKEPWQDEVTEEVALELLHRPAVELRQDPVANLPPKSGTKGSAAMGAGGAFALAVLFILLVRLPLFMMKNAGQRAEQRQPDQQALQQESDRWNEKIKRGEDVPEPILMLAGIDPEEYKEHQKRVRRAAALKESSNYARQGLYREAAQSIDNGLKEAPDEAALHNSKAWLLATCPDEEVRDGVQAIEHGKKACELTEWTNASYLDTLAASYAEAGEFELAIEQLQKAIDFATDGGQQQRFGARLELYKQGQTYRDGVPPQRLNSPTGTTE